MSERRWKEVEASDLESMQPVSSVAQSTWKGETNMKRDQMVLVVGLVILVLLVVAVYAQRFVG
jgi:hypothetical protein